MNLLLDASLPPRLARALHQLASPEHRVDHVRDVLGNDASDRHIADHLAAHPGSSLIGIDLETTATPHRLDLIREGHVPVVLLRRDWLDFPPWEMSWKLAARLPAIVARIARSSAPTVYLCPPPGEGPIRKVS